MQEEELQSESENYCAYLIKISLTANLPYYCRHKHTISASIKALMHGEKILITRAYYHSYRGIELNMTLCLCINYERSVWHRTNYLLAQRDSVKIRCQ